jgi:DNA-binding MarR family transcriptional regulator
VAGIDGYVLEEQIGFRLRLAMQRHLELFAAALPDLTPTQFSTLVKLAEGGVVSQNQLGRLVAMDAATTKGVIDRLRRKGLVESRPSASDRRRLEVSLTPAGAERVRAMLPRAQEVSAQTLAGLSADEAAHLVALLDRIGGGVA